MFSANEARNNTQHNIQLQRIEDRIRKASANNEISITVSIMDDNYNNIVPMLEKNGYSVTMVGIAGYYSYYYKISWY